MHEGEDDVGMSDQLDDIARPEQLQGRDGNATEVIMPRVEDLTTRIHLRAPLYDHSDPAGWQPSAHVHTWSRWQDSTGWAEDILTDRRVQDERWMSAG
jgi:hypothetical protein